VLRTSVRRGSPLRGNRSPAKPPSSWSSARRLVVLCDRWWTSSIPGRGPARSKPLRVFARALVAGAVRCVNSW